MKILIHGAGWYGCHLALALADFHEVKLIDIRGRIFGGASGANPARLHLGYHYPRSHMTRASCQAHNEQFLKLYGHLARSVRVNHYGIAENDSLLDFATYRKVLEPDAPFEVDQVEEWGYRSLEGIIRVPEQHLVIREVREYFEERLQQFGILQPYEIAGYLLGTPQAPDVVIDCTFCAGTAGGIARYEPCVMGLLEGKADRALTVMDGPFPSIYPWDEDHNLSSLTSASLTPLAKCLTYVEAQETLKHISMAGLMERADLMVEQMARFWPDSRERYKLVDVKTGIRAQPTSAADSRYCAVENQGTKADGYHSTTFLVVKPGKIDSVLVAEREVLNIVARLQ